jgi:two-component system sensor histidine kinase/response regulator
MDPQSEYRNTLLSEAFEQLRSAILITDSEGTVQFANPAFEDLTGYNSDEILGKNMRLLKSGTYNEGFYAQFWQTLLSGEKWAGPIQNKKKNQELYWEHMTISPMRNENGEITHFVAIKNDISEEHLLNTMLAEQGDSIQALLLSLKVVIFRVSTSFPYKTYFINQEIESLSGYMVNEFISNKINLGLLIHPEDKHRVMIEMGKMLKKHNAFEMRCRILDKSEKLKWVMVKGRFIVDSDLKGQVVEGFIQEITQQVEFEEQLTAAKKKSIATERFKSEFVANMSHELRTPLNGILGMVNLLQDTELNEEQEQFVEILEEASSRLFSVIQDLLDFSQLQKNDTQVRREQFNLIEEMRSLCVDYSHRASIKGLSFQQSYVEGIVEVFNDRRKIRQAIRHLLNNALKFTSKGSIGLHVSFGQGKVSISVEDTGIGIEPELKNEIFQSFKQGEDVYTKEYEGLGLGLSLTEQIAQQVGAEIAMSSEQGKGSVFTFKLPYKKQQTEVKAEHIRLDGRTIYLAEDEGINRFTFTRMLEIRGARVVTFVNGKLLEDALQTEEEQPDVILLDLAMPVQDGQETLAHLRKMEKYAQIPIVIITAYAMDEPIDELMAMGANDVLSKPVREKKLIEIVHSLLDHDD